MGRPQGNLTGELQLLPNPNQTTFLDALDKKLSNGRWAYTRLTLFAGRQSGKTRIGSIAAAMKAINNPGSTGWVCGPTYPDLNDFVQPAVFEVIPDAMIADWSEQHKELHIHADGKISKIQFRSLDDPEKGRGPTLDWAWIDEACKIQEKAWQTLSPALGVKQGQAWFTTTPKAFDWVYRAMWMKAVAGEPGYWALKYRSIDSPVWTEKMIEDARRDMDPKFFAQEYEADFVNFAGAVYDLESAVLRSGTPDEVIRQKTGLREWPRIDPDRSCIVGIDPGADHPFAAALLVATEKGMVVVGEHLLRNKPPTEHARGILQMLALRSPARPLQPLRFAIDRSARLVALELQQFGINAAGAENAVVDGIRRVQSWLAAKQLFFIEDACPRMVEQMRGYEWADQVASDGTLRRENVKKVNDDLPDALRYALMTWPSLPERDLRPSEGLRDISQFDDATRWAIERSRRIMARETEERDGFSGLMGTDGSMGMGDFWGNGGGDDLVVIPSGQRRAFFAEE